MCAEPLYELAEILPVSPLASSRNANRVAGLREGRAGEDLPRNPQQPPWVDATPNRAHSQQSLLQRAFHEVIVVRPAHQLARRFDRRSAPTGPPEVAGPPAHDDQKEPVTALPSSPIRSDEIEQCLPNDVVDIFTAISILRTNRAPRISNDGFRGHTAGCRYSSWTDLGRQWCRRCPPPGRQTLPDAVRNVQPIR